MTFLQLVTLAFVQGVTEFLPVSSSAHLILVAKFSTWTDQGLSLDIAAHLGSLIAVCVYFRKDINRLCYSWFPSKRKTIRCGDKILSICLIVATLPIVLSGLVFHDFIAAELRSVYVIGVMTIVFGVVLYASDAIGSKSRLLDSMNWRDAIYIGMIQTLALIPGTSRSGVTISAALLLGFSRESAVRFSFLLGIPTILAAVVYEIVANSFVISPTQWLTLGTMTALSAVFAYGGIYYFIRLLDKIGMLPFILYRLILGLFIIVFSMNFTSTHAVSLEDQIQNTQSAIFAGGCFWCLEEPFDSAIGVNATTVGYIGGSKENANYNEVSKGHTRHVEAIKVTYDPSEISFAQLLAVYWKNIDPFDSEGQFCDRGQQYASVVYFSNQEEEREVSRQLEELQNFRFPNNKIVTAIKPAVQFYPAEHYHQNYYLNNPVRYKLYRYQCGRDSRLREVWQTERSYH